MHLQHNVLTIIVIGAALASYGFLCGSVGSISYVCVVLAVLCFVRTCLYPAFKQWWWPIQITDRTRTEVLCAGYSALPTQDLRGGLREHTIWKEKLNCCGPHRSAASPQRVGNGSGAASYILWEKVSAS